MHMRILFALGLLLSSSAWGAKPVVPIAAPEATATEFFRWYLGEVMASREPLRTERKQLATYVEPKLMKRFADDGVDPFTDTEDYEDDWDTHVRARKAVIEGTVAHTIVTLGATRKTHWQLDVTLAKSKAGWRIRKVFHVPSDGDL